MSGKFFHALKSILENLGGRSSNYIPEVIIRIIYSYHPHPFTTILYSALEDRESNEEFYNSYPIEIYNFKPPRRDFFRYPWEESHEQNPKYIKSKDLPLKHFLLEIYDVCRDRNNYNFYVGKSVDGNYVFVSFKRGYDYAKTYTGIYIVDDIDYIYFYLISKCNSFHYNQINERKQYPFVDQYDYDFKYITTHELMERIINLNLNMVDVGEPKIGVWRYPEEKSIYVKNFAAPEKILSLIVRVMKEVESVSCCRTDRIYGNVKVNDNYGYIFRMSDGSWFLWLRSYDIGNRWEVKINRYCSFYSLFTGLNEWIYKEFAAFQLGVARTGRFELG